MFYEVRNQIVNMGHLIIISCNSKNVRANAEKPHNYKYATKTKWQANYTTGFALRQVIPMFGCNVTIDVPFVLGATRAEWAREKLLWSTLIFLMTKQCVSSCVFPSTTPAWEFPSCHPWKCFLCWHCCCCEPLFNWEHGAANIEMVWK